VEKVGRHRRLRFLLVKADVGMRVRSPEAEFVVNNNLVAPELCRPIGRRLAPILLFPVTEISREKAAKA
jgi:hypothetical protein